MNKKGRLISQKTAPLQNDAVEPLYITLLKNGLIKESIKLKCQILAREMNQK